MIKNVIISNAGNESIALIQWAIETAITPFAVICVDTQETAAAWSARINTLGEFLKKQQIPFYQPKAPGKLSELITQRQQWPTHKHLWCASLLKGATINALLDDIDPMCEATILQAKMRFNARRYRTLSTREESSEFFNGRALWFPLLDFTLEERNALMSRAGFEIESAHSLECAYCIHAQSNEQQTHLSAAQLTTWDQLNRQINRSKAQTNTTSFFESYSTGCGAPWGCGE